MMQIKYFLQMKFRSITNGNSLIARFIRGSIWSILSSGLIQGANLLISIVAARILGSIEYGELGIINSTISTFAVFSGIGLGVTAAKYISEYKAIDLGKVGRIISLSYIIAFLAGLGMGVLFYAFAESIAIGFLSSSNLIKPLRISSVLILLYTIDGLQSRILNGFEKFSLLTKINFLKTIISILIIPLMGYMNGLHGILVGYICVGILNLIATYIIVIKIIKQNKIQLSILQAFSELHLIWKFSIPAFFSSILLTPVVWISNSILVKTTGYHEMGILNAVYQWRTFIMYIPAAIATISLPMLSGYFGKNDQEKFKQLSRLSIHASLLSSTIIALPILIFSRNIMTLYGSEFTHGSMSLSVMSITAILIAFNGAIGQGIMAIGESWWGLIFNLFWALVFVGFTIGLANYGAIGISYAYLISYFLHTIWQSIFLIKRSWM